MAAADNSGSVGCGGPNSGSSDVSGGEGSMAGGVPMEDDRASSPAQTAQAGCAPAAPSAFLKRVGVDEDVANNNREAIQ